MLDRQEGRDEELTTIAGMRKVRLLLSGALSICDWNFSSGVVLLSLQFDGTRHRDVPIVPENA